MSDNARVGTMRVLMPSCANLDFEHVGICKREVSTSLVAVRVPSISKITRSTAESVYQSSARLAN